VRFENEKNVFFYLPTLKNIVPAYFNPGIVIVNPEVVGLFRIGLKLSIRCRVTVKLRKVDNK
jgi:predicted GH43/DUF377 family glycosyl hydrolase